MKGLHIWGKGKEPYRAFIEWCVQDLKLDLPVYVRFSDIKYNLGAQNENRVVISPYHTKDTVVHSIAHELRHVQQYQTSQSVFEYMSPNKYMPMDWYCKWKNDEGVTEYYLRKSTLTWRYNNTKIHYINLPWEVDANTYAEDAVNRFYGRLRT